ncbi:F-box protein [Rhynchospora pubera]|uniref:F-box protein n=1 Tax=Rhynchospora pubera TaxID=906938 RepID=A0AAV8HJA5_9POAL|nr:F-box protein [Rhynchospora pubera]
MAAQEVGMLEELIMRIFGMLPTKALMRCKAVCHTWEKLIGDQFFTQTAYSRVPYTASFTITSEPSSINKAQGIVPMHAKTNNLPSTITRLLSRKFKVLDSSNGLLCLRRDEVLLVGNPITSLWAEIPKLNQPPEPYHFAGATVLSFNPASSLDFYVLVPVLLHSENDNKIYDLQFHVFSSETWSWELSPAIRLYWNDDRPYDARLNRFVAGPRGGSIYWMQGDDSLMGYEINNDAGDAYWTIPLPKLPQKGLATKWILNRYDGSIYHLVVIDVKLTIWRLEGKENWVLEGEWKSEGFKRFVLVPFAIDRERGMLFIKGRFSNELAAFHLANSRWETICKDASIVSVFRIVPYAAFDVSFAGGLDGDDAIDIMLRDISKAPVKLN